MILRPPRSSRTYTLFLDPTRFPSLHLGDHRLGVDVGRAEQFERARCPPALAERCALDHHGAGIGARHIDVRGVGAGIDPHAVLRPAEAGAFGLPALHRDHAVIDIEPEVADEPMRSEEHTSELQSLMRTSYAVFCLK